MSTREQIAERIREEHRKHPTLDWADIASAKILSAMREEAQPSAPTVEQLVDAIVKAVDAHKKRWAGLVDWTGDDANDELRNTLTKLLTNP